MDNRQSISEVSSFQIYEFKKQQSSLISTQKWEFKMNEQRLVVTNGIEELVVLTGKIILVNYKGYIVYYSHISKKCIVFRDELGRQQLNIMTDLLSQKGIKIYSFAQITKPEQQLFQEVFGNNFVQVPTFNQAKVSKGISYKIGGFFGAVNNLISKPAQNLNKEFSQKINDVKEEKVSSETKGKWETLKTRAGELNHAAGEAIKPVGNIFSSFTGAIGQKFDQSENSVIKGIRNFGNNLKNSINDGYKNNRQSAVQPVPMDEKKVGAKKNQDLQSSRNLE